MAASWFVITFFISASFVGFSKQFQNIDDGRIVGGEPADIESLPHQLSVRILDNFHFCGASIIGRYWAVSAGHCFSSSSTQAVLVAGTSFTNSGGQRHEIERVIRHPSFNSYTKDSDIALLKVKQPFALGSPGISCIPLARQATVPGTSAVTSGWGSLEEGKPQSTNQLQKVVVPVVSRRKCNQLYSGQITETNKTEVENDKDEEINLNQSMLCAGYDQGGKDACQGDSGGPLVAENKLIGVVSWGRGCARPDYPGVYADVNKFYDWILRNTGDLGC